MQAALIGPSGQIILGASGLTIGRMQSNQFVVFDPRVSAQHAIISLLKEGTYTITDRGSTNGTFVNGLLLSQNVPHLLHSGDTIRMGDTILTFQISNALQIPFEDKKSFAVSSPAWDGSATDRFIRMRYGHNETSLTGESQQHIVTPSTKDHRRILISLLLAGFVLMGVMVFSVFEYLNYLHRSTPDRTLGNFCSALKKKG